ncbi:hypothetical protein EVAR_12438_1 [Eumeta japonica]|uniref:Uncharacterized protein n=1 Tax=Eumeta variegata TaxID=151549 RepID=A0A4C1U0Q4_EUMVA|nr:hypothetical protein EVAR_12438_1 [Eumeta japonica]
MNKFYPSPFRADVRHVIVVRDPIAYCSVAPLLLHQSSLLEISYFYPRDRLRADDCSSVTGVQGDRDRSALATGPGRRRRAPPAAKDRDARRPPR